MSDSSRVVIERAGVGDVPTVTPLFGAYRGFYEAAADAGAEAAYLRERIERGEAVVLVAWQAAGGADPGDRGPGPASRAREAIGFTLMYPTFTSVAMRAAWILNDLYVAPGGRQRGVGRALLEAAAEAAREAGAMRLELRTAHDNVAAQRLYEAMGWKMDERFRRYTLGL
ncbi:MAG: GNAT family N-acetyltransferase [Phycisphaeraceae bacterium]|nr:GNAT family N-acetyltransferase [Phycisphaeraceae bacterium]